MTESRTVYLIVLDPDTREEDKPATLSALKTIKGVKFVAEIKLEV